jgi:UDP-glucose 4-epimerase
MKTVLLTGGTGFVGANLARQLLIDGHQVHLLVRRGYRPWRIQSILPQVEVHEIDLLDPDAAPHLLNQVKPDWIFHLAVYGAYSHQQDLMEMINTNIIATTHLMQAAAAAGFEAFVNAGSSSEYGFKDHPHDENDSLVPNSEYSVTKGYVSNYCRFLANKHGLNISTLRLYSVYGPYEEPTRLMPQMVLKAMAHALPPLVSPDVARDFVYIDDVVRALLLAAGQNHPGKIYNICSGQQTTIRDLVDEVFRTFDFTAPIAWGEMPNRTWDTNCWVGKNQLARAELGWAPETALDQGLSRFRDWLLSDAETLQYYQSIRR